MLLRTFQRSVPKGLTRTFSTSRVILNNNEIHLPRSSWTRSGLMRLRKNQLEELAQENNMDVKGTKSDIVERLLKEQPKAENSMERRINTAVAEEASHENNLPGTKETFMDTVSKDVNNHVESQPGSGGTDPSSSTTAIRQNGGNMTKDLEAERWMEAFELKLGSSRLRSKPKQPSMFSSSKPSQAPPSTMEPVEQHQQHIKEQQEKAASTHSASTADKNENSTTMPDDIDQAWVKAFEQKTTNRNLRHQILGKDSFRASLDSAEPNGLDWIQTSKSKGIDIHDQLQKSAGFGEQNDVNNSTNNNNDINNNNDNDKNDINDKNNNSSRNYILNSIVGSSLLIWIVSGQNGFTKIASFLTTSSS
ncbi:hypothetical protein INT45_011702 [Circinella minor]|uniref:SAP domain-containing protein n=1 Tax=Circinella minor TaxID=1195481 RepID=A0A8H7VMH8_9FUNG|nr:hypothetical protein INT45_011702 [Circinella minor]